MNPDALLNRIRLEQRGLIDIHKKLYEMEHLLPAPDPMQFAKTAESAALLSEKSTAHLRNMFFSVSNEPPIYYYPKAAEVQGIRGWGNDTTLVVEKPEQIENLPVGIGEKLCVVSQTTFNYKKFQDLVEKFEKKGYDILVLNTICNATQERQVEARRIASEVDAMIVIGGRHSSNTQKLYEICQKECKNTYFIQSLGDFNPECVNSVRSVGITAGASTPNQIIEEVHTNVRIKF